MKYGFGYRPDHLDHRDHVYQIPETPIPGSDLRSLMTMPIYDQRETNSCVAHATARVMHYLRISQSMDFGIPSRLFIYYGARLLENDVRNDSGCEIRDAIKTLAHDGAPPESSWPFAENMITKKPPKKIYDLAQHGLLLQYQRVPQKIDHIRSCLNHKIPIVFGFSVFSAIETQGVANTGVVPLPRPNEAPLGGHAVYIVGDQPDKSRIVFCNSWGADWGDGGYGYLPYDYILNDDLADDFWAMFLVSRP